MPALWRADKLLSKAEKSGVFPNDADAAEQELTQQLAALRQAEGPTAREHLGRALFALVRLARSADLDPEAALTETCQTFVAEFSQWEAAAEVEK